MLSDWERELADLSPAMARRWHEWEADPANLSRSARDCVQALLAAARDGKAHARLGRTLARNALPAVGLPDVAAGTSRGLSASLLRTLGQLDWVDHGHTVVVTGPSGAGKSHLAVALLREALLKAKRAELLRVPEWLDAMEGFDKAKQGRELRRLGRVDLVVLDDVAVEPMTSKQGHVLRRLIDARHGLRKAMLVASPVPPEEWDGRFGDDTAGEAICRRLLSGNQRIDLTAPR